MCLWRGIQGGCGHAWTRKVKYVLETWRTKRLRKKYLRTLSTGTLCGSFLGFLQESVCWSSQCIGFNAKMFKEVCCICLATKYVDDDELRELPCFHVLHVECDDK